MTTSIEQIYRFLARQALPDVEDETCLRQLASAFEVRTLSAGDTWCPEPDGVASVCLVMEGLLILRNTSAPPRVLAGGDGLALHARRTAADQWRLTGVETGVLLQLAEPDYPAGTSDGCPGFDQLLTSMAVTGTVAAFSASTAPDRARSDSSVGFLQESVGHLMTRQPLTVAGTDTIQHAAQLMRDRHISCLPVVDAQRLVGLLTEADMTGRVVATGRSVTEPVAAVMTPAPTSVQSSSSVFDLISLLTERQVAHAPVVDADRLVGVVTQTDLVKRQTASSLFMVHDVRTLTSTADIARVVGQVPNLLRNLVDGGGRAVETGRMISAITDAVTRRLIELAEEKLGPAPGDYVWLACGSQGRQEQTGATDQDNVLVISDTVDMARHGDWYKAFAEFVCRGLDEAGYVFCPGGMMAMNERWRKPLRFWRQDFRQWIDNPGPEAQMLASVMFDLRAIHGNVDLYRSLQEEALRATGRSSIFIAHLASNALTHRVPLGMFGRLATERRGPHQHRIDLKHRGVVPIIDLARIHALASGITAVNTVERLRTHNDESVISAAGLRNLLDAYEFISILRLRHQAEQVKDDRPLDNFLDPSSRSALERDRLRRSFLAIRDIQSAMGNRFAATGRG